MAVDRSDPFEESVANPDLSFGTAGLLVKVPLYILEEGSRDRKVPSPTAMRILAPCPERFSREGLDGLKKNP
jgi:hypothetical protein